MHTTTTAQLPKSYYRVTAYIFDLMEAIGANVYLNEIECKKLKRSELQITL